MPPKPCTLNRTVRQPACVLSRPTTTAGNSRSSSSSSSKLKTCAGMRTCRDRGGVPQLHHYMAQAQPKRPVMNVNYKCMDLHFKCRNVIFERMNMNLLGVWECCNATYCAVGSLKMGSSHKQQDGGSELKLQGQFSLLADIRLDACAA